MAQFTQTPTGDIKRDIRTLFDWMRAVHGTGPPQDKRTTRIFAEDADTLSTVSERGATTDEAITIGDSVTLVSGDYTAVISINAETGRLEAIVNGKRQQSW